MEIAPIPPDEAERLRALRELEILDTLEETAYDSLTLLASTICQTPIALVSLVDEDRQWFKSHHGLDARETPRDLAFCAHAILESEIFEVSDSTRDPRFADNPLVTGEPKVRFYAGAPLTTPTGHRVGTLCVIDHVPRELTPEQSRALEALAIQTASQLELRLKVRELEAAAKMKSRFISTVTHELRTPLTAIIGYLDIIDGSLGADADADAEELRDLVSRVQRSSGHLLLLINDILDLSKIEDGKLVLTKEPCEVTSVLAAIESLVRPLATEKRLDLSIGIDGLLPTVLHTDPHRLQQVLVNITGNAIKFTKTGSVNIRVRTVVDCETPFLEFTVRDTGVGIAPEKLGEVFEPFTQARQSDSRDFGGTGLGLDISRRLIVLLGGHIEVESTVGEGSTFRICLDLDSEVLALARSEDLEIVSTAKLGASKGVDGSLTGLRILVADDNPDNRNIISHILNRSGATIECVENGLEALLQVTRNESEPFDAILMDMQMPVMDGFEATRELQRRGVRTPVLAITALGLDEDRERCESAGCCVCIRKPIDPVQLVSTLRRWVENAPPARATVEEAGSEPPTREEAPPARLRSVLADDPTFAPLLQSYLIDLPSKIHLFGGLLETRDFEELCRETHKVRGTAGSYGFPTVSTLAGECEDLIRAGGAPEKIIGLVSELRALMVRMTESQRVGGSVEASRSTES